MREHRTLISLLGASALAAAVGVGFAPRDRNVIENRGQAMPKGAQKAIRGSRRDVRTSKQRAADELVRISNQTLVVTHLQPRWLRQCVVDMMAAGANIDMAAVALLKSAGPEGARMIVEAYVGD